MSKLDEKVIALSYAFGQKIPVFETTGKLSRTLLGNLMKVLIAMGEIQKPIAMEKIALAGVSEIGD